MNQFKRYVFMNLSLLNSLCYTVGWFWCVLFGIHDQFIVATIGAAALILFQLYCTKMKDTALYIQDVLLVIFSVPLGVLLEIFFIQTNLIRYVGTTNMLPPIWIILLYPLFSLVLNHSLKIIKRNYFVSFLFGFLGAPLSYIAGVSLGGLTFSYPLIQTWMMIGICWGLFLCLFAKIANIVEKATAETLTDRDSKNSLKLLYDGECPICKREICILQKKDNQTKITFIDISSKEYAPSEHNNIDYGTAMSQIHAIDGKGNVLVGLSAFAAVYASCQLLITSTLLRIPFMKRILEPFYKLFAKKRLWLTGRMQQKQVWISCILFVLLCLTVQVVGSFWTKESVSTWYPTLVKPSWVPPDWIFAPVWTFLYILIAVSGWLIYQAEYSHKRTVALMFYGGQLALNFIWPFLFFFLRSPILGLIDIVLVCLLISLTIIKAWSVRPLASVLLIPYLLWVMYATSLNAGIWLLNR